MSKAPYIAALHCLLEIYCFLSSLASYRKYNNEYTEQRKQLAVTQACVKPRSRIYGTYVYIQINYYKYNNSSYYNTVTENCQSEFGVTRF